LRAQATSAKAAIARAVEEKVWPLLAAGRCRPLIHTTFPLTEAARAHALMETSAHIGKIVLTV
jgi:NADPH:quinone reductase